MLKQGEGSRVDDEFAGGLEYYASYGSLAGFDSLRNQQQQIFPTIDVDFGPQWEFNFGVGIGATSSTDHLIVKCILIADERQLSIGEDWRGAVAVWIVERTQRQTPTLVAIRSVGQQSEVAKEHVNIGSICDWRWRGGAVCRLETLHAFARRLPPP